MRANRFQRSMYLEEKDLLEEGISCPFCGLNIRKPVAVLQENPLVKLLECGRCHAVSASRMPNAEVLQRYYDNYYNDNNTRVTISDPDRLASHIYRQTSMLLSRDSLSILDFGGGNGAISIKLAEKLVREGRKKVRIDVVDYNTELATSENDKISVKHVQKIESLKGSKYALIMASAVLEHIAYPVDTMTALMEALDHKGVLYARTPYIVPMMKLFNRVGVSIDFTYPGHVHDLGQGFWDSVTDSIWSGSDLEVIRSSPSIPELSIREDLLSGMASYALKAPWKILGNRYKLVGGWEIIIRKR